MTCPQYPRHLTIAVLACVLIAVLDSGCHGGVKIPSVAQPRTVHIQSSDLTSASGSVKSTDPDLCLASGATDPSETPIGGLSSRAVYQYASQPHVQNLYASLVYESKVCTGQSLSSADETRLQRILAALGITSGQSFAATLSLTADGQGVKYPLLTPFSYAYDTKKTTHAVQEIGKGQIPWQVSDKFDVIYSYGANTSVSIDTANLFNGIVTDLAGSGSATALLAPASKAYLTAGQDILQNIATSVFTRFNSVADTYTLSIVQDKDRSIVYRFRDVSKKPLAAVRISVVFTNSIEYSQETSTPIIDPTQGDDTSHIPQFQGIQPILSVIVMSPVTGAQTLLQQISKEQSYQDLLKATTATDPQSFASYCDALEPILSTTYGLNKYDVALTMAQILSQENTLYLNHKAFYNSGCFRSRGVLKTMGITDFDTPPPNL